ncbi:MAG: ACP S-malonyltransferase [Chitinophagales bacterium]|nr:ACP S-malonyltransferase [Chitinophagales bacterium]
MKAYLFPGQGSQFAGMGKDLYNSNQVAKQYFEIANEILGYRITDIMFNGTEEELKQTKVTQPAIFLFSIVKLKVANESFRPEMVAGHSLGEFSALVANQALLFEDALHLVYKRAVAMQKACELKPSTMAAILGLDDHIVEEICASVKSVVVPANYNCPGQLVISGTMEGIATACEMLLKAGAKRALPLPVGGAFHSPLMEPAQKELKDALLTTSFFHPICPIYQNVTAFPVTDPEEIRNNLIAQLTAPVRWSQSVKKMIVDGATEFIEAGPGNVLQALVKKIDRNVSASSL